jgi:RNA-directed DNA polymerase
MQAKLHQWAKAGPRRRFHDLYNLVYDPAFLVVAWSRVLGNRADALPGSMGGSPLATSPGNSRG